MQLHVQLFTGATITVDFGPSDTIGDVKDKIQEKENIPFDRQELGYYGTSLEDDKPVSYYNIEKESTLQLDLYTESRF